MLKVAAGWGPGGADDGFGGLEGELFVLFGCHCCGWWAGSVTRGDVWCVCCGFFFLGARSSCDMCVCMADEMYGLSFSGSERE